MDELGGLLQGGWLGVYLRVVAIALAYSALIHLGNMLGWTGTPWLTTPLAWRVGDVVYLGLDALGAVGLWRQRPWGLGVLLVAVASQFLLYTAFIQVFAKTAEQRSTIYGLLATEAVAVAILAALLGWQWWRR